MPTTFVRRTILFLLFAAVFATAWPSSAAGAQRQSIRPVQAGEWAVPEVFNRLWSFLGGVDVKDGCHIDPFGRCATGADGCHIDPNGRCVPEKKPTQRKEGCNIDPDGRCRP